MIHQKIFGKQVSAQGKRIAAISTAEQGMITKFCHRTDDFEPEDQTCQMIVRNKRWNRTMDSSEMNDDPKFFSQRANWRSLGSV
jgi:hypothetical protein